MTNLDYTAAIWNLNGRYWDQILMALPDRHMTDAEFYDWVLAYLGI